MSRQQRERALRDEAIRWRDRLRRRDRGFMLALDPNEAQQLERFLHRVQLALDESAREAA